MAAGACGRERDRGSLARCRDGLRGDGGADGEDLLRQIDRVTVATSRILELRPDHPGGQDLARRNEQVRAQAIGEREKAVKSRLLKRVAAAALGIGLVLAVAVALLVNAKRQEAEQERQRANEERDAKAEALTRVLRLADSKKVRDLIAEADDLWPVHPDTAPAMKAWIDRAKAVIANRRLHEDALAAIRERADDLEGPPSDIEPSTSRTFSDPTMAWRHEVVQALVSGIATLADGEKARLRKVETRLALSEDLVRTMAGEHEAVWAEIIGAIADRESNPQYEGLRILPMLGLIPLGPDPRSKLHEFAHMGSGSVPTRDPATGELVAKEDAAIVLVLIPGGTFLMGAQKENPAKPNFDPQADVDELPVHEVTLNPYLIAKYECTQGQWAALTDGERPSGLAPGVVMGDKAVTDRNPVESVSWEIVSRWLGRHRLRLPTEARWEHACRAGTATPWITGGEAAALSSVANLLDAFCKANGGAVTWTYEEFLNDGHAVHAPVGSFEPNGFGLHDMLGNVYEWCEELYIGLYGGGPADGDYESLVDRVCRGGGWISTSTFCRSADRSWYTPEFRTYYLGFRAAMEVRLRIE